MKMNETFFEYIDNNKIHGNIIKADTLKIDDSKFTILPVAIEGEEWEEVNLESGMLICSSK